MRRTACLTASILAATALIGVAQAQPAPTGAPPPGIARVMGTVTALTPQLLTVREAAGKETDVALAPGWTLVRGQRVGADALAAGEFVATANVTQPDGAGKSVELRIFEPGAKVRAVNRPMAEVGQVMTNGTVAKVSDAAGGRGLDVAYPGGVRHIVVPADLGIIQYSPAATGDLKVGDTVTALAARGPGGALTALRVSLDPAPR